MADKLVKTGKVFTDSGWQRWSMHECSITRDVILRFGSSYTLRGSAAELGPLFQHLGVLAYQISDNWENVEVERDAG